MHWSGSTSRPCSKPERKVALKVLRPALAAVIGAERFLAEIKTTAKLQHPHILPLFDSDEADGFLIDARNRGFGRLTRPIVGRSIPGSVLSELVAR